VGDDVNIAASSGSSGVTGFLLGLVILVASVLWYFAPLIVAWKRHVPNVGSIAVVNFFTGWTGIGWVVALAMACRSKPHPPIVEGGYGHPEARPSPLN
jgi:Superinfection immunity protein